MKSSFGKPALFLLCLSLTLLTLVCAVPQLIADKKEAATDPATSEQKRAVHALNRLTFGPRPGDVQQVTAIGVDKWIDLQLHPEKISDSAIESRLAPFRTLRMSSREMVEEFPDQQMIRQVMDGKKSMPSDPARRAVFQVQIARMQQKKEKKQEAGAKVSAAPPAAAGAKTGEELAANASGDAAGSAKTAEELAAAAAASGDATPADSSSMNGMSAASNTSSNETPAPAMAPEPPPSKPSPAEEAEARRREERLYADLEVQKIADLPPDQHYKKVLAMSPEDQLAFADSLRGGRGQEFLAGLDPKQKETLLAMNNPQGVIADELIQAKMLRAIYSERQLEEVMTDFWFNHFNVFVGKGADRVLLTNYEQDVIRPRAMGKFEDLLTATAKSPAMLFYLDNWLSVGPNSMQAEGIPARRGGPYYGPYGRRRFP